MAVRGSTRISPATRQRVLDACRVMGYRPPQTQNGASDAQDRSTATQRVGLVLVGTSIHNPVNAGLMHTLSCAGHDRAFRLEIQTIEDDSLDSTSLVRRVQQFAQPCTGVLLCGQVSTAALQELSATHPRVAMLGWPIANTVARDDGAAGVVIAGDDEGMGRYATTELLAAGYRRIAFVAEFLPPGASHARWLDGYRLGLLDAGLPVDPALIHMTGAGDGGVLRAAQQLCDLDQPPEAFVVTDMRVAGVLLEQWAALGRTLAADAMIIWGNPTLARLHGVAGRRLISIDLEKWVQAALHQALAPQDRALSRGSSVLVPFITHGLE